MIRIEDLQFIPYLTQDVIEARVSDMGTEIVSFYKESNPHVLIVLNGAYVFGAQLSKHLSPFSPIAFVKVASYEGLKSKMDISLTLDVNYDDLGGRDILIVEDIVDTGHTIHFLANYYLEKNAASVRIATLLFKEEAFGYDSIPKFIGFHIPNKFVIGSAWTTINTVAISPISTYSRCEFLCKKIYYKNSSIPEFNY